MTVLAIEKSLGNYVYLNRDTIFSFRLGMDQKEVDRIAWAISDINQAKTWQQKGRVSVPLILNGSVFHEFKLDLTRGYKQLEGSLQSPELKKGDALSSFIHELTSWFIQGDHNLTIDLDDDSDFVRTTSKR